MEKIADIKAYNDMFVTMVKAGQVGKAQAAAQSFTRNRLREESFAEKVLTPIDISNDELDKSENPELLVKWNDREPDTAPAVNVPYGVVPDGLQFFGTRFPSYFSRILSPWYNKDIDKLRGYDYDIRSVLLDLSTKEMATRVDTNFVTKINSVIGSVNTANPLNGMGLPQWVTISGGINRDTMVDATNVIKRLTVPFGPLQPDGGETKGLMLMNNITASAFLKFNRTEVGGDLAQKQWVEGTPSTNILGIKSVFTLKRDLIPDNTIYFFSSEEFFGKYYRLQPLTVFMKNEAFFLMFMQYMNISLSFGNIRGVTRVDFV